MSELCESPFPRLSVECALVLLALALIMSLIENARLRVLHRRLLSSLSSSGLSVASSPPSPSASEPELSRSPLLDERIPLILQVLTILEVGNPVVISRAAGSDAVFA